MVTKCANNHQLELFSASAAVLHYSSSDTVVSDNEARAQTVEIVQISRLGEKSGMGFTVGENELKAIGSTLEDYIRQRASQLFDDCEQLTAYVFKNMYFYIVLFERNCDNENERPTQSEQSKDS
jgi:hypothetical protein